MIHKHVHRYINSNSTKERTTLLLTINEPHQFMPLLFKVGVTLLHADDKGKNVPDL